MTDRRQLARECAEIEKIGGSVRDYLACCGFVSPWGTWYRLQIEELGRDRHHVSDGKGEKNMRKLTLENKKKAVQIALDGGNPLKFLKEIGMANPSASWQYIKKCLKVQDPGKYDLLAGPKEPEEKPAEAGPDENWSFSEVQIIGEDENGILLSDGSKIPRNMEMPKIEMTIRSEDIIAITKPVNYGGFDVMALKDPETGDSFVWDDKHGRMDWRNCVGEEVSMTPEAWHKLIKTLPQIMEIFGI